MEFSRQEYWSGLPFPTPGNLPDPGIETTSLVSPALAGEFFITAPSGKPTSSYGPTNELLWEDYVHFPWIESHLNHHLNIKFDQPLKLFFVQAHMTSYCEYLVYAFVQNSHTTFGGKMVIVDIWTYFLRMPMCPQRAELTGALLRSTQTSVHSPWRVSRAYAWRGGAGGPEWQVLPRG